MITLYSETKTKGDDVRISVTCHYAPFGGNAACGGLLGLFVITLWGDIHPADGNFFADREVTTFPYQRDMGLWPSLEQAKAQAIRLAIRMIDEGLAELETVVADRLA